MQMENYAGLAAAIRAMPIARHIGLEIGGFGAGTTELHLPFRKELSHDGAAFQAGALATLADFAGVAAINTLVEDGRFAVSAGLVIEFLAPARGEMLLAVAEVAATRGRRGTARTDIYAMNQGQRVLCATAIVRGHIVRDPGDAGA